MNKTLLIATLCAVSPALSAQCSIPPCGPSLNLDSSFFQDEWTAPISIGFAFPFDGATYNDVYICDHGLVALNNGGVPGTPPAAAAVWDPLATGLAGFGMPVLAPYWSDHTLKGGPAGADLGQVYIDTSIADECRITWHDVQTFHDTIAGTVFTVQLILRANGEFEFLLDKRVNNDGSSFGAFGPPPLNAIIGFSQANAVLTLAALSVSPSVTGPVLAEQFSTTAPSTPNPLFDLAGYNLQFLPINPAVAGSGYSLIALPLLPCGTSSNLGGGCSGMTLQSITTPSIGNSWDMQLSGVPAPAPFPNFLAFGQPIAAVPIGAIFPTLFGATCLVHHDATLGLVDIGPDQGGGSTAVFQLSLPADCTLLGILLGVQGLAFDIFQPAEFALSNGELATIGY